MLGQLLSEGDQWLFEVLLHDARGMTISIVVVFRDLEQAG